MAFRNLAAGPADDGGDPCGARRGARPVAAASLKFAGCFPASDYINPVYERCANE